MKIKKEITVTLSTNELKTIVKEHLLKQRIKVSEIYFNVKHRYEDVNDHHGSYVLEDVECKGQLEG